MKEKTKATLMKMSNYCNKIFEYIKDMDFVSFSQDTKTVEACVFNLSQIGELVQYLDPDFLTITHQINWQGVKGLRNRIVHDYDGIKINTIWQLINEDLHELLHVVDRQTQKLDQDQQR